MGDGGRVDQFYLRRCEVGLVFIPAILVELATVFLAVLILQSPNGMGERA